MNNLRKATGLAVAVFAILMITLAGVPGVALAAGGHGGDFMVAASTAAAVRLHGAGLLVLLPELRGVLPERDDVPGGLGAGAGLLAAQRVAARATRVAASGIARSRLAAIGSPQISQMP